MHIKKIFIQTIKNQEGAVIVIIAVFMAVLIGIASLVLDLGFAFYQKTELQKDLDSVVLAAVRELPATSSDGNWDKAVEVAEKYAELNSVSNFDDFVITKVYNDENTKIIGMNINGDVDVTYNFAKIFGFSKGTAAAESKAEIRTVEGGMKGLLPFVIDYQSMLKIKNGTVSSITIKSDADGYTTSPDLENTEFDDYFGNGWFGPVDIDRTGSSSATAYSTKIATGSTVPLNIGDTLQIIQGNMVGPTAGSAKGGEGKDKGGFNLRFQDHLNCTYDKTTNTTSCGIACPRICTIPVVTIVMTDDNKKIDHLEVRSFASVFVELDGEYYDDKKEEINFTGNDGTIKVTFIKETFISDAITGDLDEEDIFGVYAPRLTN